jgi:hypothetical protein
MPHEGCARIEPYTFWIHTAADKTVGSGRHIFVQETESRDQIYVSSMANDRFKTLIEPHSLSTAMAANFSIHVLPHTL